MFYDINLDQNFTDFEELEKSDFKGFCMSFEAKENLRNISPPKLPVLKKPIYTRVNVDFSNKLDSSVLLSLQQFNLVCIKNVDNSSINSIVKMDPDLIQLKFDEIKHLKKTFANLLKEKDIFIEITTKDALYGSKERVRWMNGVRRLIKLGCTKNLVFSSNASVFTELKDSNDICKMLNLFGISDDVVKKILSNSEKVLRKAALKRYSSKGICATTEEEGIFKQDFVINYHRSI